MVEEYAMVSNVKSLELATRELKTKLERIQKVQEEMEYFNKLKGEKEDEIKKQLKEITSQLKEFHQHFQKQKK